MVADGSDPDGGERVAPERDSLEIIQTNKSGADRVLEVVMVVGDPIGDRRDSGFDGGSVVMTAGIIVGSAGDIDVRDSARAEARGSLMR
jgi:hypothetical protein